MTETMIFLIVVGGGCWALKQWLAYLERQQIAGKLSERQGDGTGPIQPVQSWEIERYQAAVTEVVSPQAGKGGLNKWVVIALCVFYIVWPIDIVPDFIPVLGWGDDVVAAVIGLRQLFK